MAVKSGGVVIVGGGVVGLSVAYFLGRAGVATTVVERDTIGSHASGFALGGLSPVTGSGVDPVLEAMAFDGMRIHAELGAELPAETGLDTDIRPQARAPGAGLRGEASQRSGPLESASPAEPWSVSVANSSV